MSNTTPPPTPGFGPPMPSPQKKNRTNAYIIGGAAAAVAAIIAAGVIVSSNSNTGEAEPAATTATEAASPTPDITDQLAQWRDNGGGETLQTLIDDLTAVQKASDPTDFAALREACSTLTANIETAQLGDPVPDEDTNNSWNLALDHLAKSATACTNGAISENQDDFDLSASEMDIGIKHLNAVNENLDKALEG